MTPPPTDEFENLNELRSLREAVVRNESRSNDKFAEAAFTALGPEGCVTRELETARLAYQNLFQNATRYETERDELKMMLHEGTQLKLAKALAETRNETIRKLTTERDVLKDEVKRLQSEIEDLRCALKDE